jgi:hypothetical protein
VEYYDSSCPGGLCIECSSVKSTTQIEDEEPRRAALSVGKSKSHVVFVCENAWMLPNLKL